MSMEISESFFFKGFIWTLLTFRSNFRLFPSHICSIWFCEVPLLEAILVISLSVEKLVTVWNSQ